MAGPFDYNASQQAAFEALAAMGACIGEYDEASIHVEMTPAFGHTAIGDAELPRVIDYVNAIGNVRNLDLGETAITDASAPHLGRLLDVSFLSLNGTAVTDRTVPFLKSAGGLKELVLSGTCITDGAIATLLELRALTFLQLYETRITKKGMAKLKAKLQNVVEA
jgi:hypothetical protein